MLQQPVSLHHARDCSPHLVLKEHRDPVGCLAWSLDDSILLTGADRMIRLWNTEVIPFIADSSSNTDICGLKTGVCTREIHSHSDLLTALVWLPDDSGFISGSLDREVVQWVRIYYLILILSVGLS